MWISWTLGLQSNMQTNKQEYRMIHVYQLFNKTVCNVIYKCTQHIKC